MSEFQLEPDPFEDQLGVVRSRQGSGAQPHPSQMAGSQNDLEMHGPPSNDASQDIFTHQGSKHDHTSYFTAQQAYNSDACY